jgi:hypothetical protein
MQATLRQLALKTWATHAHHMTLEMGYVKVTSPSSVSVTRCEVLFRDNASCSLETCQLSVHMQAQDTF